MKTKELNPGEISDILFENIHDRNARFIFPTDVVMNSWTDFIIQKDSWTTYLEKHPNERGTSAIAQEQFSAWDNFKTEFVSAHQEKKSVIPTILRKMFVTDFIDDNSKKEDTDPSKFKVIINSTYKDEATSFTEWLCDTLKTLHFWKKRLEKRLEEDLKKSDKEEKYIKDEEDEEFLKLYDIYKKFLDDNNLFEPSWVEEIEFKETEKTFHIFYPELLEDFADYIEIFDKVDNITVYRLPNKEKMNDAKAYLFEDSRKELRYALLKIRNIVKPFNENDEDNYQKADWSEIALSVPDIETYRPYLEREFEAYGIPYVIKAGISYTKNAAGKVFRELQDCESSRFSYDSLRSLLLDENMPWTEEVNRKKEELIKEGNRMRCICSVKDDIWEKALKNKIDYIKDNNENGLKANDIDYYEEILNFYKLLKEKIYAFFGKDKNGKLINENNTFENIYNSWMDFKNTFFNEKEFTVDANNILSRCVVELKEIMSIEKEYKEKNELNIPSPFNFFLQELDKKIYTKQTKESGVNVFPYRLSAAAYFKYQFVIDGSQRNLDVPYRRLTYLSNKKREMLGLTEEDRLNNAGDAFIKLYAKNTLTTDENFVHFTAATTSFAGFIIPHNSLDIVYDEKKEKEKKDKALKNGKTYEINKWYKNFDEYDYVLNEKKFIKDKTYPRDEKFLLKNQIDSYNQWASSSIEKDDEKYRINRRIEKSIKDAVKIDKDNNIPKISARGTLEYYFPCPRKWILGKVLKVKEDSLDTNLMSVYDTGSINHRILELFMMLFIKKEDLIDEKTGLVKNESDRFTSLYEELKLYGQSLPYFDEKESLFKHRDYSDVDFEKIIDKILFDKDFNIVREAIQNSKITDFKDSPLAIEAMLSQEFKTAEKIKDFLKFFLLPYEIKVGNGYDKIKVNGMGNCKVVGVEYNLELDEKQLDCEEFKYSGNLDCLLVNPPEYGENFIIIDYKNTKAAIPSRKHIFETEDYILGNFQMPVYYRLVSNSDKSKEIDGGYFYAIKDKEKSHVTDRFSKEAYINKQKDNLKALEKSKTQKSIEKTNKVIQHLANPNADNEALIKEALNDIENFDIMNLLWHVDYTDTCHTLDEYSKIFIDEISKNKDKSFIPFTSSDNREKQNVKNYKTCKDCKYKNICRTTYTIAGKSLIKK